MNFGNNRNPTNRSDEEIQRILIDLLNSNKPRVSRHAQTRMANTTITREDVDFLKAANDVIKLHQYRVDPTIRDVLSRLQYAASPHGGVPLSKDYLNVLQATSLPTNIPPNQYSVSSPSSFESGMRSSLPPTLDGSDFPRFSMDIFKPEESFQRHVHDLQQQQQQQQQLQHLQQQQQQQQQQQHAPPQHANPHALSFLTNPINASPNDHNMINEPTGGLPGGIDRGTNEKDLVGKLATRIKNLNASEQHNLISKITELLLGGQSTGSNGAGTGNGNSVSFNVNANGGSSFGGLSGNEHNGQNQNTVVSQAPFSQFLASSVASSPSFGAPTPNFNADLEPVYKAPKLSSLTTPSLPIRTQNGSSISLQGFKPNDPVNDQASALLNSLNRNQNSNNGFNNQQSQSQSQSQSQQQQESEPQSSATMGSSTTSTTHRKGKTSGHHNSPGDSDDNSKPLRSYNCGKCGISFKRSSDLKRHEKTHLEIPPNICPLCHKGFARKDALKRHVDTLTCRRNRERLIAANGGEMPPMPNSTTAGK
ncbi:unnamed protein product [Ambrosiozyma monospora]|uniref:Unnamed protein product n=1 Tax=Ambrosiozyma monospora TaxID=43982 RepID=A0A9W7DCQ4_AMBMO|nr:unnamed protein product [Ambrosiozyma monospora]